jgi:hypothetical protein
MAISYHHLLLIKIKLPLKTNNTLYFHRILVREMPSPMAHTISSPTSTSLVLAERRRT